MHWRFATLYRNIIFSTCNKPINNVQRLEGNSLVPSRWPLSLNDQRHYLFILEWKRNETSSISLWMNGKKLCQFGGLLTLSLTNSILMRRRIWQICHFGSASWTRYMKWTKVRNLSNFVAHQNAVSQLKG